MHRLVTLLALIPLLAACGSLRLRVPGPTFHVRASADASGHARASAEGDVAADATVEAWAESTGGGNVDVVAHGDVDAPEVAVDGAGGGGVDVGHGGGSADGHGGAPRSGDGHGASEVDAGIDVRVDAVAHLPSGPITLDASAAGGAPRLTGRGPGVRGAAGGIAHLGAFLETGLDIDGALLTLDELGPLSVSADADADGRFVGDGAIDAWASLSHETLARDGGETQLTVRVRGAGRAEARAPLSVHLVLDRSSSMQGNWAEAVDAAEMLIAGLAPTDFIHIVAYGTRGEEVLPSRAVGDGALARRALARVRVGGGTHIEAGLDLAYREVRRAPASFDGRTLVILVSDGVPNEGEIGAEDLAAMARAARVESACTTTVIGLGDQFDADVLAAIARDGRGGYYLARTAAELRPALEAELRAHTRIAARDVRLSLDLGDGVEVAGIFDGGAGAVVADGGVSLTLPKLAAGEERRVVVTLRVAAGTRPRHVASARLAYRVGGAPRTASGDAFIGFGARAVASVGAGGLHAIDGDLGQTLADVGRLVSYGEAANASARLRAHVALAEAHPLHRSGQRLQHRTSAVARLATLIDATVPRASHTERRQVGLSLGALSVRFAR